MSDTEDAGTTQVEVDTTLAYKGDISENFAESLFPAVRELGVEGERHGLKLTDKVRVTGTLTLEVISDE